MSEDLREELKARWPQASLSQKILRGCLDQADASQLVDLYLARAAASGEAWALRVLEDEVFLSVRDRLARQYSRAHADEAVQQTREQLLLLRPGLGAYQGRGALKTWVLVIATRRLIAQQERRRESLGADPIADTAADSAKRDFPLLHARYSGAFKIALRKSVDALTRRERLVMRLHFNHGLSAEKIAAIFHVHRGTASKWILDARTAVRENVLLALRDAVGICESELRSIGAALYQHTDLSLPRFLADEGH